MNHETTEDLINPEQPTKDLTDSDKLNLILAELADLRAWRAKVDAFMEDRSRDTRPKLEIIHKELADTRIEFGERITTIEKDVKAIRREMVGWREDFRNERIERIALAERLDALEQRPS